MSAVERDRRLLRVASPHYGAFSAGNIDVTLLFDELTKNEGIDVSAFSRREARRGAYEVIHVHWPEWMIDRSKGRFRTTFSGALVLYS